MPLEVLALQVVGLVAGFGCAKPPFAGNRRHQLAFEQNRVQGGHSSKVARNCNLVTPLTFLHAAQADDGHAALIVRKRTLGSGPSISRELAVVPERDDFYASQRMTRIELELPT
jgi:hypothetical protein